MTESQSIKAHVQEAVKAAMRAQDKDRLNILRLIMSEFKRIEVDERIELDSARELAILDKMQKQRRDSVAQFNAAGRQELAQKEQFEIDVIQSFKPAALSDAEIHHHVVAAIAATNANTAQDMGKVMAILKPQLQGRADLAQVGVTVKQLLAEKN